MADALAAVYYHLTHNVNPWAVVDRVDNAGYAATLNSPKAPGHITGILHAGFGSAMELIRYQRGMGYS